MLSKLIALPFSIPVHVCDCVRMWALKENEKPKNRAQSFQCVWWWSHPISSFRILWRSRIFQICLCARSQWAYLLEWFIFIFTAVFMGNTFLVLDFFCCFEFLCLSLSFHLDLVRRHWCSFLVYTVGVLLLIWRIRTVKHIRNALAV